MKNQTISDTLLGKLPNGTQVLAASPENAKIFLATVDDFVRHQSRFDRQARLNLEYHVAAVSLEMHLNYVSSQAMPWQDDEIESLKQIIVSVADKFFRLNFTLPEEVFLVKTTGLEEGFAAYTRALNVIALPENMVQSLDFAMNWGDPLHETKTNLTYLENVIIHEFFHLFSKNNPSRRDALYQLVNYQPTGNDVELPDIPWRPPNSGYTMRDLKITNPDTPVMNTYIEMEVPSDPALDTSPRIKRQLLPILLASGPYAGGSFFQYLQWWFMTIEKNPPGHWVPVMNDKKQPILYDSSKLMSQYLQLIGRNLTGELFHPDEILAQNFVFVANQPSMELLSKMGEVLR